MLVHEGKITMSAAEAQDFQEATFAPWTPRTIAEFNAMCDLGSARHLCDNTGGVGFMHALVAEEMKFGPEGQQNYPLDKRRIAYARKCMAPGRPMTKNCKAFEETGLISLLRLASGLSSGARRAEPTQRRVLGPSKTKSLPREGQAFLVRSVPISGAVAATAEPRAAGWSRTGRPDSLSRIHCGSAGEFSAWTST
jgi:hypothetical protein